MTSSWLSLQNNLSARSTMFWVCERMGVPVATEKKFWTPHCYSSDCHQRNVRVPSTCITFLGIVLDSSLLQLRLPPEKCEGPHCCSSDCHQRNVRVPSTCITFLGIVLDSSLLQAGTDIPWWNSFLPFWNSIHFARVE